MEAEGSPNSGRQLEIIRRLSTDLLRAPDIDSVLWTIARSTMTALGYEDCVIYLADAKQGVLIQRAAHGPKSPEGEEIINPIVVPFGAGIVGSCAQSRMPQRVDDTMLDPRYIVDDESRRSELAVPVIDNGEVIAVIDSEHSEPGFYSPYDEQALVDIASIASARLRAAMTIEMLHESINELELARHELDTLAKSDHLTGLLNRRGFEDRMRQRVASGEEAAVALIDLDRFKGINDTHGHRIGDDVLCAFAEILIEQRPHGACEAGRLGGDEFGLMAEDSSTVIRWVLAVLGAVRAHAWEYGAAILDVTASVGVATTSDGEVWGLADEALFLAKNQGGDQLVVYDKADPRLVSLHSDRNWASRVRDAMAMDHFVLFGQPIVHSDGRPGLPAFYEMLLRYRAANGRLISPGRFLGAAERFGLAEEVDMWVTENAISWLASQEADVCATANVSAHFVGSSRALTHLARVLESEAVNPSRLCIEITETTAIADMVRCSEVVSIARKWGCKVAIDDFGKGWTSLPLVRDLNVDILKIDGEWVQNSLDDQLSRSVVTAIMETATIIGVEVVAEWVEDDRTVEFLQDLGVHYLQGFLTGVPAPLAECGRSAQGGRSAVSDSSRTH